MNFWIIHPFPQVGWVSSHPQDERALPHWSLALRVAVELQGQLSKGRTANAQAGMDTRLGFVFFLNGDYWWVHPGITGYDWNILMNINPFLFFGRKDRYGSTGLVDLLVSYVSLLVCS